MKLKLSVAAPLAAMLLLPSLASAHPAVFHQLSVAQGMIHPLTGLDHLLAMVCVGIWAAQQGGRALWLWPLAFVSLMLVGGTLGMAGIALPLLEPMIAASVLVLGLLIASAATLPLLAGGTLIGLFALLHGNAHGLELPESTSVIGYALGFSAATALLHLAGLMLGHSLRQSRVVRLGGLASAAIGGIMLFV